MTRKLSNWSKPGEKPPMTGVWETDFAAPWGWRAFQWFDGAFFYHAATTPQEAY